jgi:hypothetical protein
LFGCPAENSSTIDGNKNIDKQTRHFRSRGWNSNNEKAENLTNENIQKYFIQFQNVSNVYDVTD